MKVISYLVYLILWEGFVLGGCAYVVFGLGYSGWWFALAVFLAGSCFRPERWSALWDEAIAENYRREDEKPA